MICKWCRKRITPGTRRDAKFCSKACRQSSHRFGKARITVATDLNDITPITLAYADPPYPGNAARYYADHPDYAGEVDHPRLIADLEAHYPAGWALSTSAAALRDVLTLCPPGVRVAAWFRGERPVQAFHPLNAWEPVIYSGGRAILHTANLRRTDTLQYVARARRSDPGRVIGTKPAAFYYWIFQLLGALPGDTLVDLYPGSAGITRAWRDINGLEEPSPDAGEPLRLAIDDAR